VAKNGDCRNSATIVASVDRALGFFVTDLPNKNNKNKKKTKKTIMSSGMGSGNQVPDPKVTAICAPSDTSM